MTTTARAARAPVPRAGADGRPAVLATIAVLQGAAFAVLVGFDGTGGWRVLRTAVVAVVTAAAVVGLRDRRPRVRGWTAVALGLAGIVTGVGIAPAHFSKAGVTPLAVTGAVILLTGLALSIGATVLLVRTARGWRKLLAVPVVAAVAQFILLPLPQSVAATNVPPTSVGRTPAAAGMTYEDVVLRTRDGVPLAAWYVPSTNGAAVVLLHGAGSTRADVVDHAAVLARGGYGVLLLDTRGHGDSGGRAMDFGWYGVPDVDAAVTHLTQRSDVDARRIGAVGLSMGGEQAITAAAADPRIRAVVAEGVGRRSAADRATVPGGLRGGVQRVVEWSTFAMADLLTEADPPIGLAEAVAATAPRPVLLIAGRGEAGAARYYRDAAPATAHLWELPDTPHTQALARQPVQWTTRVTAFLDGALRP